MSLDALRTLLKTQSVSLRVDLLPDTKPDACEQWIHDSAKQSNKSIANVLSQRIPKRIAQVLMEKIGAPAEVHGAEFSKKHHNC